MRKLTIALLCLFVGAAIAAFSAGCGQKTDSSEESGKISESTLPSETDEKENVSESSSEQEKEENPVLEVTSPTGVVFPYISNVTGYLTAGKGALLADYYCLTDNAYMPVTVEWNGKYKGATAIRVEYSVNNDFSDAIEVETEVYKTRLNLYNLLKAAKYYVRVTALCGEESMASGETVFETTDIGPRIMNVGGIYNVRDLGGYTTESGERTLQNLFFRGGALSDSTDPAYRQVALNESGKAYMSGALGIRTDFDLRNATENLGLTESPIPGATLEYYNVGGYLSAFTDAEGYRKVFSALSDPSRYPVYLHCTGGADRTGTVSFLINALLGVDETALIQDYELTSFSIYRERNSQGTVYDLKPFLEKLKTYAGETLSRKTENYMLSIGVTETEIYNIKAIMFGKPCKNSVSAQPKFAAQKDTEFRILLGREAEVSSVTVNGVPVVFRTEGKEIVVAREDMPSGLVGGRISGEIVVEGVGYPFGFEYDDKNYVYGLEEGEETLALTAANPTVTGKTVGYGGTVAELRIAKVEDDGNGGTFFMIGSYGVYFRGGGFRAAIVEDGAPKEYSPRTYAAYLGNSVFNQGILLGLSVIARDESTVTLTIYVNGVESGSCDIPRVSDEIDAGQANYSVTITGHVIEFYASGVRSD